MPLVPQRSTFVKLTIYIMIDQSIDWVLLQKFCKHLAKITDISDFRISIKSDNQTPRSIIIPEKKK